jgi:NTE family protein
MALDDEVPGAAFEMRRAIECLRGCHALAGVDDATLEALAAAAVQFSLPAGIVLFDPGSPPDGFYVLTSGRVGVRSSEGNTWTAQIGGGELVGELGWLLGEARSAQVVAIRDSELLWLERTAVDAAAAQSTDFSLAIARLCARRLQRTNRREVLGPRARIFTIVPNAPETDTAILATQLVTELARAGRTELVWDVRASSHTAGWFNHIEAANDFIVYLADPASSGWTRQCCRQADTLLLAGNAGDAPRAWPAAIPESATRSGMRIELALLHGGAFQSGAARTWLDASPAVAHHHVIDASDIARLARLLTHRGVGLVLSGGGARGFAHLGVIRALREGAVPIDFIGGASIGSIIAAGAALEWSDAEMRLRFQRTFVATNPVNDYTFPFVALTRGRKVSRLLHREFGDVAIEDLRLPFFCVSADLTTGRIVEHCRGNLAHTLRASVAIPGVLPPVLSEERVLVDGAAINNLPVDLMKRHDPGYVIGSDVGLDRTFIADYAAEDQPPLWRYFARRRGKAPSINIFQILMRAGMMGGASQAAIQRQLADTVFKPRMDGIDLLNWHAFERAIDAGYEYATERLKELTGIPRTTPTAVDLSRGTSSLLAAIERRFRPEP